MAEEKTWKVLVNYVATEEIYCHGTKEEVMSDPFRFLEEAFGDIERVDVEVVEIEES